MRAIALGVIAFVALAAVGLPGAERARANGVPQVVKLTYIEGLSNFGPHDAEGVLTFSFAEAHAEIEIKNLPPQAGYDLEGWMLGPSGSEPLFIASLPVQASGVGSFETKIENLHSYDYNTFVVAARPTGAPRGTVPEKFSIAGRFTVLTDPGAGGSKIADVRPAALPDTGESPAPTLTERAGRALFWMGITAAAGVTALQLFRRRSTK